jgi:hypothetical protein
MVKQLAMRRYNDNITESTTWGEKDIRMDFEKEKRND